MKKQILLLSVFMFGTIYFVHGQNKSYENVISFGQAQKIGDVQTINIPAVQTSSSEIKINLTKYSAETYFLIIKTKDGEYLQKLLKY